MAADRLKRNDWVLITDGGCALILRNEGHDRHPKLVLQRKYDPDTPPTRELGTDKPGRTRAGIGAGRSAMEPTDFHRQAEDRLIADVAASLAADFERQRFTSLVVAAAPQALGTLRKAMSGRLRKAVIAEIPKDFTKLNLVELSVALPQALAGAKQLSDNPKHKTKR